MKTLTRVARLIGLVAGSAAVVWGCIIAGRAGEPIPVILAGVLALLVAWVGDGWEELALKFGDNEARIKRAVREKAVDGVRAVDKVATEASRIEGITDEARASIREAANAARRELLRDIRSAGGATGPRLTVGPFNTRGQSHFTVSGLKGSVDWTVENRIRVHAAGRTETIEVSDGTYTYPDDWGFLETPAKAEITFGSGSIYDGPDQDFEFVYSEGTLAWNPADSVR